MEGVGCVALIIAALCLYGLWNYLFGKDKR